MTVNVTLSSCSRLQVVGSAILSSFIKYDCLHHTTRFPLSFGIHFQRNLRSSKCKSAIRLLFDAMDPNSAVNLFYFAINCFNGIQLARTFEDDFATYQLKLDILQIRLSRWGEVARPIIDKKEDVDKPVLKDENVAAGREESDDTDIRKKAHEILHVIHDTVTKAKRDSERDARKWNQDREPCDAKSCVPSDLKKIRMRFKACLRRRKVQMVKVTQSIQWVFYKKEHFEKFVMDMSSLMSNLESLFLEDDRRKFHELSKEECVGMSKPNLEELKELVEGCDPLLEATVDENLQDLTCSGTYITQSYNSGMVTGIHKGDVNGVSNGNNNRTRNYWGRR